MLLEAFKHYAPSYLRQHHGYGGNLLDTYSYVFTF